MVIYIYSLPVIVAFVAKILLLVYSRRSGVHDIRTRLFVVAVLFSMATNLCEFMTLQRLIPSMLPYFGSLYYAAAIPFFAVLIHLTVRVTFGNTAKRFVKPF